MPKRAHALETLAHATDFVFDKTGTLTTGKIKLEKIILNITDDEAAHDKNRVYDKDSVLTIAASLEANSEHPIAKALLLANKLTNKKKLLTVDKLVHTLGEGIQGTIDHNKHGSQQWFIGNKHFIDKHIIEKHSSDTFKEASKEHSSKIYLATKQHCVAAFILSDKIRDEAATLIQQLQQQNKKIHLYSGDRLEHTRKISEQLGIGHYLGELKPEDKLNKVKALQQQGAIVVMTGDGVNDAPVLTGANLSIAMGKGTQLAAATADMVDRKSVV